MFFACFQSRMYHGWKDSWCDGQPYVHDDGNDEPSDDTAAGEMSVA
jgi:hypothetical protein